MNKRNIIIIAMMAIMLMGSVVLSADPVYLGTITYKVYWGDDKSVDLGQLTKSFLTGLVTPTTPETHYITDNYWVYEKDVYEDDIASVTWTEWGAFLTRCDTGYTVTKLYNGNYNPTLLINFNPSLPIPKNPYQPSNN